MLGKSRTRRAKRGKYYVGKNVGIPPARGRKSNGQRRGPRGNGGDLLQVATNSVVPNAAPSISNAQPLTSITRSGTESQSIFIATSMLEAGDFGVAYSISANPADPGFLKSLAAISNQYQQFKCLSFKMTFTPAATTSTPGTVYLAFQPDCNAPEPKDIGSMSNLLGMVSGPFFGKATTLRVANQALQHAFNIQTVNKSKTAVDTTQVSPGKMLVCFSGAGTLPANGVTIGVLNITYTFGFCTPKLAEGSNQLACQYLVSPGATDFLVFDPALRVTGYHMLFPTDTVGTYRTRMRTNHLASTHVVLDEANDIKWQYSEDDVTWNDGVLIAETIDSVTYGHAATYTLPPARYYRCKLHATGSTVVDGRVYVSSLPSDSLTP